jgi:hypothetical protein
VQKDNSLGSVSKKRGVSSLLAMLCEIMWVGRMFQKCKVAAEFQDSHTLKCALRDSRVYAGGDCEKPRDHDPLTVMALKAAFELRMIRRRAHRVSFRMMADQALGIVPYALVGLRIPLNGRAMHAQVMAIDAPGGGQSEAQDCQSQSHPSLHVSSSLLPSFRNSLSSAMSITSGS